MKPVSNFRMPIKPKVHKTMEVLNNTIDEDIRKMLNPLDIAQTAFLSPKYWIRDNFITPIGLKTKIVLFIGTCSVVGLFLYNTVQATIYTQLDRMCFFYRTVLFEFICTATGFVANFLVCIFQSESNMALVVKLQEAHRNIYDKKFKKYVRKIWMSLMLLVAFHILQVLSLILYGFGFSKTGLVSQFFLFTFDVNILSALMLGKFINTKLELWIKNFKTYSKAIESRHKWNNHIMWKRRYEIYSCVMECYTIYKKVFQVMILYHLTVTFFNALIYIQFLIDFSKLPPSKRMHGALFVTGGRVFFWLMKNLLFHVLLARECERFYIALEAAASECILVESRSVPEDYKKIVCKNLRRLSSTEVTSFRLCRVVLVDAKYPLRFMSLLSTYTIVLLQSGYNQTP